MVFRSDQLLQLHRASGKRALLLQPYFQFGDLALERFVFRSRAPQRDVIPPPIPPDIHDGRQRPLHAGKEPERHRLEHRNARPRLHLCGNQHQMADENEDEQDARALSENLGVLDVEHEVSFQLPAM